MKNTDLSDYVSGLVDTPTTKFASADLDALSLSDLEALIGVDIESKLEKTAGLVAADCGPQDRYASWLSQFEGTPLHQKAIALCEQEIAVEQERINRRMQQPQDMDLWTEGDRIRLEKDILSLELAKSKSLGAANPAASTQDPTMAAASAPAPAVEAPAAVEVVAEEPAAPPVSEKPKSEKKPEAKADKPKEKKSSLSDAVKRANAHCLPDGSGFMAGVVGKPKAKEKKAEGVPTTGQVSNGDAKPPEWPRAALGVDSAGRRATPEEERQQNDTATPQHVEVGRGTKSAGLATAVGEKILGKAVSSGAVDKGVVRGGLNAAQRLGARLGGKTTESAVGRGVLAAGGATAGIGAAGIAMKKKESAALPQSSDPITAGGPARLPFREGRG